MNRKLGFLFLVGLTLVFMTCSDPDTDSDSVTGVNVYFEADSPGVVKGKTAQFRAEVTGTNNPAQTVTWSIVQEDKNEGTSIDENGLLIVAAGEALTSLTVKATSTVNTAKFGKKEITVIETLTGTIKITGDGKEGQNLSVDTGGLAGEGKITYQWKRKDPQSNEYTDIPGATSSTYTLTADDVGKFIKVTVTREGYDGIVDIGTAELILSKENAKTTVTNVTINPAAVSLLIGGTEPFVATVTGENDPDQTVTWTVTGGGNGTAINTYGVLTIAANEPASALTVKATSTVDTGKSGTAAVTVLRPTVTNVTVSPSSVSVNKGEKQQFTAVIAKENDPMQTITDAVTWSVTGGVSGTSIAEDGTLTVAFGQTANLTVKAVSKFDSGKSGTATVTVTTPPLTGSVTIEGVVQEEQTLSANIVNLVGNGNGAITYRWERGNSSTGSFTNISDATSSNYKLVTADVGKYIKLTVNRSGYNGSITSDAVGPVKAKDVPPPTVTSVTVSPSSVSVNKGGTQQFTATVNGDNNPAQTVTWTITNKTGNSTTISSSGNLTVSSNETVSPLTITATSTVDSSKSGTAMVTIPSLTGSVSITGTTQVGQILTANTGSLEGSGTITYRWARGDTSTGSFTDISGATSSTYTLVTADRGKYIRVTVTRAGNLGSVTSAAVGAITLPPLSGSVSINGSTVVGQSLTVNTGSLDGSGTITYQWKRGDTTAAGTNIGTGASYTLVAADENKYITVTVSRNDRDGSVTSNAVGPITLPALSGTVTITGTLTVDSTLTADTGGLGGSGTITYQWASSGTSNGTFANISGATSSTYKLVTADKDKYIKVTVTRAGHSGSQTSAAVGPVTIALSGTVTITGTTQVGQTLTANTSSLGGSGGTIGYQWTSSSSSSGTFANISGATSSTYTLVAADKDKYIKVTVTRTGYSGSVTSAATAQITQSASEVVKSTNSGSTASPDGLTSSASTYQVVDLPTDNNRQNVMKVSPADLGSGYAVAVYSLSAYKDKEITITLSVDVKRVGAAGTLNWQVNNDPGYPSVASVSNAAAGTWHSMSGTKTLTPTDKNPALYLSTYENSSSSTTYYIDNFTITITETSTGGGGTGGGSGFNGVTLTSTNNEQETRKVNGYDYELWNQDKRGTANMTIAASGNSANGGIFKCDWNGINNVLFRAGRKYDRSKTHSQIGTFSIDYEVPVYTLGGNKNAYISVYGWLGSKNAGNLVEYYIIDNVGSWNPSKSDGAVKKGTVTITNEGTYDLYEVPRSNAPSIDGNTNFKQYFSIRNANRTSGTISVTKHFEAWAANGMTIINTGNLYEVALKVESYAGASENYNSSGKAEVTKNILKVNGTPIQ